MCCCRIFTVNIEDRNMTSNLVTVYNTVYQEIHSMWRNVVSASPDPAEMKISNKMEF